MIFRSLRLGLSSFGGLNEEQNPTAVVEEGLADRLRLSVRSMPRLVAAADQILWQDAYGAYGLFQRRSLLQCGGVRVETRERRLGLFLAVLAESIRQRNRRPLIESRKLSNLLGGTLSRQKVKTMAEEVAEATGLLVVHSRRSYATVYEVVIDTRLVQVPSWFDSLKALREIDAEVARLVGEPNLERIESNLMEMKRREADRGDFRHQRDLAVAKSAADRNVWAASYGEGL